MGATNPHLSKLLPSHRRAIRRYILSIMRDEGEAEDLTQEYISDLSDSYRAVIMLHDMEGLTNPEIASMLGVSLDTVKIRLHRARAKLRKVLGEGCTLSIDERGASVCEPRPQASKSSGDVDRTDHETP